MGKNEVTIDNSLKIFSEKKRFKKLIAMFQVYWKLGLAEAKTQNLISRPFGIFATLWQTNKEK